MTKKIYGNANSDGFGLYMLLITALFGAGGVALAKVGGIVLLAALPVFVLLCALMAMKLSKWDVMSEPRAHKVEKAAEPTVRFPVAGETDTKAEASKPVWNQAPSAALPVVEKPKSSVETNTHVA